MNKTPTSTPEVSAVRAHPATRIACPNANGAVTNIERRSTTIWCVYFLMVLLSLLSVSMLQAQTTRSWNGASGGAWLTATSWSPTGTFAGGAPLANPTGEGANTDIMSVVAANASTNIGINMNTLTAAGGVGLILGGIDYNKTNTAALQIGNNSTTVNGIMQINGATINSVANTLIRVAGSADLVIANVNTGTGTQTMGLRLGSTSGIFDVATSRTLTISSNISEATTASGFTKNGAGTLVLSGTNSYTGITTLAAGALTVATGASLPGPLSITAASTTLNISGTATTLASNISLGAVSGNITLNTPNTSSTEFSGVISGGSASTVLFFQGGLTSQNSGALTLSNNNNTFQGRIDIQRGPLILMAANAAGTATIRMNSNNPTSGTLQLPGNFTIANAIDIIDAGESIGVGTGFSAGISGNIGNSTGANGFQKLGAGILTLSGTNTHAGTTDIQAGTLRVSGGSAISDAGAVSLANVAGATFELSTSETVASIAGGGTTGGHINLNDKTLTMAGTASTSFGGVVSGTGGVLTKTAASTGTLTLTGTNTYTGGTNLNGGILSVSSGSGLGTGGLTIGTGAASGTGNTVRTLLVNNTAAVTLANDIALPAAATATTYPIMKATSGTTTGTQLNLTGVISGGGTNTTLRLTSDTSGDTTTTYRLVGNNTFSGKIELFRGAIVMASSTGLGTATLQLNGNNNTTLGNLRFESTMTVANNIELVNSSNSDPMHTNGNTVTLSGVISSTGTQALSKIGTGTLILTGTNTYTVGTTISGGTLQVGNGATTGSLGSTSGVTNNATLAINRSNAFSLTPVISGTGSLSQDGSGTTTVTGNNTFTGDVKITGGKLSVGTVAASTVAQPLGQGTTAVNVSGGGELNYTGPATTWNRAFTVATASTGTINNTGSGTLTMTGPISKDGSTLTLKGSSPIKVDGIISGASANSDLVVDGTTVTLSAANTYNGPTTVTNGGTLNATNTTGSATGVGNVEVVSSTIVGTGTLSPGTGGTININTGSTVSVGNAGDTTGKMLTFSPSSGTTTFKTGSILELDLFSGAGAGDQSGISAAADIFRTGGSFSIESGVKLKVSNPNAMTAFAGGDTWKLLDWMNLAGSAPVGTFDTALLELPELTGQSWDLSRLYDLGTISIVAVPEPSRALLLAIGVLGLISRRRR